MRQTLQTVGTTLTVALLALGIASTLAVGPASAAEFEGTEYEVDTEVGEGQYTFESGDVDIAGSEIETTDVETAQNEAETENVEVDGTDVEVAAGAENVDIAEDGAIDTESVDVNASGAVETETTEIDEDGIETDDYEINEDGFESDTMEVGANGTADVETDAVDVQGGDVAVDSEIDG